MLPSMHVDISRNTPVYVFEIQQVLLRENLPVGTENAMLALADGLTTGTELRTNLERIVQAIIHREGGRIDASELLSLILMASANPVDPLPSVEMERAMYETLGFILEVRHPVEKSREAERDAGVMLGKKTLPSSSEPLILSGPLEKDSIRGRSTLVISLCALLVASLVVGLSRRRNQAGENAGVQTRALPSSGSGNRPNTSAPVVSTGRGTEWLLSHNAVLRSKARVQKSETSDTKRTRPWHTTNPLAVDTATLPVVQSRLHNVNASTNIGVPSVSNSIIRPKEVLASPTTGPGTAAAADVPTALVAPAIPVRQSKPDASPRTLVQSGSAGIMAANLIWSPTPAYPAAASEAKVEGEVTVNALVGKEGNVLSARVVSGPPLLREAALKAVEKWQYRPYFVSGKPAVVATTAIIDFELAHE
jgi:TonB family protein